MTGYGLHPEAYTDIQEIAEYIAADSLNASTRVVNKIFDAIEDLDPMPHQGHIRLDLTSRPCASGASMSISSPMRLTNSPYGLLR